MAPRKKTKRGPSKKAAPGQGLLDFSGQSVPPTFRQMALKYREDYLQLLRHDTTRNSYRSRLKHLEENLPDYPIGGDLRGYLAKQVNAGKMSVAYANQHIWLAGQVCRFALQYWPSFVVRDFTVKLPHFQEEKRRPKALRSEADFAKLLQAVPDHTARAYLCVLRFHGLRRSEALGLELRPADGGPPHVDLGANMLRVVQQRFPWRTRTNEPKTAASAATHPRLHPTFREYTRLAIRERMRGEPVPAHERRGRFLFHYVEICHPCSKKGKRGACGGRDCLAALLDLCKAAVPGFTSWHHLRHTFARDLQHTVRTLHDAQEALRHSSPSNTVKYYEPAGGAGNPSTTPDVLENAWANAAARASSEVVGSRESLQQSNPNAAEERASGNQER